MSEFKSTLIGFIREKCGGLAIRNFRMLIIGITQLHTQGFSKVKRIFQLTFEVVFALFEIYTHSLTARTVWRNTVIIF